ncbi:MAG TPA: biotin--[acetyl-CoA-carboxylase] ligase [Blastocatellia bacterium]|nr:biotin--[acetyl-CoA-carboxylase] ligase [Blastocatellia bacterium]
MPRLGSAIIRYDSVTSTNDVARDLASCNAPEGTIVLARQQTSGRGRQGRTWESPAGEGLYLSAILRPSVTTPESAIIPLAAAVAVAETLTEDFDVTADIKWPNDVLVSGRKICGILVESAVEASRLEYVIVGIGVNVNQQRFPPELLQTATSLRIETGKPQDPGRCAEGLLRRLEPGYRSAISNPAYVISRWEARSTYARGRVVRVISPDGVFDATTRGLSQSGALRVELNNGEVRELTSAEITLRATDQESKSVER